MRTFRLDTKFLVISLVLIFFLSGSVFAQVDVYLGGSSWDSQLKSYQPGYWLNGEWHNVESRKDYVGGAVWALVVSNQDIYLAGSRAVNNYSSSKDPAIINQAYPGYWKNDTWVPLEMKGCFSGEVKDIFVSGSDVYAVGYRCPKLGGLLQGGYWKNGIWKELSPNLPNNYTLVMRRITVIGSDVYVTGGLLENDKVSVRLGFWKNDVWYVPVADSKAETYEWLSLEGVGDQAVCFGKRNGKLGYQQGRTWVQLDPPSTGKYDFTRSLAVGTDVYALGSYEIGDRKWASGYWKNGHWVDVTKSQSGISLGIAILNGTAYLNSNQMYSNGSRYVGFFREGEFVKLNHPNENGKIRWYDDGVSCIVVSPTR